MVLGRVTLQLYGLLQDLARMKPEFSVIIWSLCSLCGGDGPQQVAEDACLLNSH